MARKKKTAEIIQFPQGFGVKQKPNIRMNCPYGKVIPFTRFLTAADKHDISPALLIHTDRYLATQGQLEAVIANGKYYMPDDREWAYEKFGHARQK